MHKLFRALCLCLLLLANNLVLADQSSPCSQYIGPRNSYLEQKTIYGYVFNELKQGQYQCSIDANNQTVIIYNQNTQAREVISSQGKLISNLAFDSFSSNQSLQTLSIKTQINQDGFLDVVLDTIYGNYILFSLPNEQITVAQSSFAPPSDTCSEASDSCAMYPLSPNSKLLFNFSGRMFQCVTESMNNLFFNGPKCEDITVVNSYYFIVSYLKNAILALLIFYLIGFGIKVAMEQNQITTEAYLMTVIKVVLVIYFTTGFSSSSILNNQVNYKTSNGITDLALPLLTSLSSDLSQIVFAATKTNTNGVGLCEFDASQYPDGYGYYALFDMIDCRVGYFLGYGMLFDAISGGDKNVWVIFHVIFALLLSSPIAFIFSALFIYFFVGTLIIKFVGHYIVCFIFLYIMASISPLFIPMVLFKQTKSMFDGWLRTTLSFALQPTIFAAFITMMLTIYDQALYADCVFSRSSWNGYTTFSISSNSSACSNSYGYQLYQLYTTNINWRSLKSFLFDFNTIYVELKFIYAGFQALIISYIIYKFAFQATSFAAALTGGVAIDLQQEDKSESKQEKNKNFGDSATKGGSGFGDSATKGGSGFGDTVSKK